MGYPKEFEQIDRFTSRLEVPGGWLIRTMFKTAYGCSVHSFFLPYNKFTSWELNKEEEE